MIRSVLLSSGLLVILGCAAREAARNEVPRWHFAEQPLLDVGVAEGDEAYELDGASSSLRLSDGRVLVANTGSNEIRVYDSLGHFASRIGRKGSGPGEFSGGLQLVATPLKGFAVYDRGEGRLSRFDSTGAYVDAQRIDGPGSFSSFPLWVWLYRANWIVGPTDSSGRPGVSRALLGMGDPPPGAYRYVQVAGDGRIWSQVRLRGDSTQAWQVHSPDGVLLAIAELPQPFEIHQLGSDFVIGRHWDASDVEHISVFSLVLDTARAVVAEATPPDSTDRASLSEGLKVSLRNLVVAQEMFYADNSRYATVNGTLDWEAEQGAILHLMEADRRGWVGLVVDQKAPVICGMAVGNSTPPGWGEGSPKCGSP
ncbi:MAG: 6-bladed beta-propeller [Gemmatimonadota bacterium]